MSPVEQRIAALYKQESGRVLATLIRLLKGNFDLAEEALQDAFVAALSQWQRDGIPNNPRAWLVSTGRFKAIDRIRKNARLDDYLAELANTLETEIQTDSPYAADTIEDDRLRLIFTCCHPSLAMQARVALTLREVCGLTTEAIAAAFLVPASTLAQRIVRAKNKIRDAAIPYEVPEQGALPARRDAVLAVVYLVFNEGYTASSGPQLMQSDLSREAIRLGRLLSGLLPDSEVKGLLALMLLHDARRDSRANENGDIIPLDEQDRTRWNRNQIKEGCDLVIQALRAGPAGEYALQAAIAAVHAEALVAQDTDWIQIVSLYDALLQVNPSPVVALNRAAAIAMRDGPLAGLEAIDRLAEHKDLQGYYLLHAARADLFRRLDQAAEACRCYQLALRLAQQAPEQRFLQQRLAALQKQK
jgi:RNA polymerase sigma-70 factor (ECF subfamily)|tara:strand:- start:211373 stop:212620 length:1248 start_codon:yes stop_codon:yes gene_type:complete